MGNALCSTLNNILTRPTLRAKLPGTETIEQQMRTKLKDEDLANKLIPNFALGCRRLTVGWPIVITK